MTATKEIKDAIAKKILNHRSCGGMRFETVRRGFDQSKTVEIVYAIGELLDEGVIEMHEWRFEICGDWKTETTYRKRFA